MKKKIIIIFLCFLFLYSCGKKGDPEYKDPNKEVNSQTILISKA